MWRHQEWGRGPFTARGTEPGVADRWTAGGSNVGCTPELVDPPAIVARAFRRGILATDRAGGSGHHDPDPAEVVTAVHVADVDVATEWEPTGAGVTEATSLRSSWSGPTSCQPQSWSTPVLPHALAYVEDVACPNGSLPIVPVVRSVEQYTR